VDRIVAGVDGKKKHLARQNEVLAAHKKWSETRYLCSFWIVLPHKGLVRNIIELRNTWSSVCSFLSTGFRSVNYTVKL
jgi:hypothetical protein